MIAVVELLVLNRKVTGPAAVIVKHIIQINSDI